MKTRHSIGLLNAFVIVLLLLIGFAGCKGSSNVKRPLNRLPIVILPAPTTNLEGGLVSTWTASWVSGTAPFSIAWDFGGGAENIGASSGTSPSVAESIWLDSDLEKTYTVVVTVTDSQGLVGFATTSVIVAPTPDGPVIFDPDTPPIGGSGYVPPFVPNADTLYAIPLDVSVTVGEHATILVYTGETAHPFQLLRNVGVVLDGGVQLIPYSINYGDVGGDMDDADGVWSDITADGGFLIGPEVPPMPGADPEGTLPEGAVRYDFNVSPNGGTDQPSVTGSLFNFQVTYSIPGEKQISFQEFNGVNRTYYSDMASLEDHFWGAYVGGTILVTE